MKKNSCLLFVTVLLLLVLLSQAALSVDNKLRIKGVDVKIDGKTQSGSTITDIEPGSNLVIDVELENNFDEDDNDSKIEDIEVKLFIKDIDEGDDVEDNERGIDIDAEDKHIISFEVEVPKGTDEGDYEMTITTEGTDEDNNKHSYEKKVTLVVEKEKHKVEITEAELIPSTIRCGEQAEITIRYQNLGANDEDLKVEAVQPTLNLDFKEEVKLDKDFNDDDSSTRFRIGIFTKEDTPPGDYPLTVRAYYAREKEAVDRKFTLKVTPCKEEETQQQLAVVAEAQRTSLEDQVDQLTSELTRLREENTKLREENRKLIQQQSQQNIDAIEQQLKRLDEPAPLQNNTEVVPEEGGSNALVIITILIYGILLAVGGVYVYMKYFHKKEGQE